MVTHRTARDPSRRVFRAIADPTRRAILDRLSTGDGLTVEAIAAAFPVSRPAISRHLRVLRSADLVRRRKHGRERVYRLNPEPITRVEAWAAGFRLSLAASLVRLKEHVEGTQRSAP